MNQQKEKGILNSVELALATGIANGLDWMDWRIGITGNGSTTGTGTGMALALALAFVFALARKRIGTGFCMGYLL